MCANPAFIGGIGQKVFPGPNSSLANIPNSGTIIPEMGTAEPEKSPLAPTALADALFTPVQQRVLGLLFGEPNRRFQSAALIRLAGSGTGATHRVLKRLADSGLVRATVDGRQKYYQANPDSPVFEEMVGLVRKTSGLVNPLRKALAPLVDSIRAAFVYGSIASGHDRTDSDIDLMVIAEGLAYSSLFEALQSAETQLDRAINPNLLTPDEWRRKSAQSDSFAATVQERPRLFVLGSDDDLQ